MQNEENVRQKAPQRYSQPGNPLHPKPQSKNFPPTEDDEDLDDQPYEDTLHRSHNNHLKEEILQAIGCPGPRESYGNLTHGISKELDDEKRLIDERMTRQIIEDSYKLPTEHIMKYST